MQHQEFDIQREPSGMEENLTVSAAGLYNVKKCLSSHCMYKVIFLRFEEGNVNFIEGI